jgi:ribosomal protein S18 acetylase RimI-like enzyme
MPVRAPDDVRLRRVLDGTLAAPAWPAGFTMRTLEPADAPALHALLVEVFDDGEEGPFEQWWPKRSSDAGFDPALTFLVFDRTDRLVAAACCWTSGFLKDLAVHPSARRNGIAEALLYQVFAACQARGARHVDLKTGLVTNADAVRLYRRLGMVEVDWEG